jgi:predicted Holliday junction resolvase-like endonuclease
MYALIAVAVTFILTIVLVLYNFSKIREISENNDAKGKETDDKLDAQSSNLEVELDQLREEIYDKMDSNLSKQKEVDANQNEDIGANMSGIDSALSNIENNIEPQLLLFDGNFKSIESVVNENKDGLADLQEEMAAFNSEQLTWNDQFSNQQASLIDKLNEIQDKDFSEKIANINKKMKEDLIPNVKFNSQSIANISNKVDTELINDIDDLSNKYMSLSSNAHELAEQTYRLSDIVDTHDLLIKST